MPYKHNESRRHKIKKSRYKVTNWHDYNNGLRQRGDFTIWFTEEAIAEWHPAKTRARDRQQEYSDIAIETAKEYRKRNESGAVYDDPRVAVEAGCFDEVGA